mgnify:CR=1 FL=1
MSSVVLLLLFLVTVEFDVTIGGDEFSKEFIINRLSRYWIYFAFAFIGFFSLPVSPISMDLSLECVYPIPEATATGINVMAR